MGVIVNADEIEALLKAQYRQHTRILNLHQWQLTLTEPDLDAFRHSAAQSSQPKLAQEEFSRLRIEQNVLLFPRIKVDSYLASRVAEFLRYALLAAKQSFTFETVMSHPSKLEFLRDAQVAGYRTYLYLAVVQRRV